MMGHDPKGSEVHKEPSPVQVVYLQQPDSRLEGDWQKARRNEP
jgi:hypothetical protein